MLETQYRTDELESCSFLTAMVGWWTDDAVLTLREVARKFNMQTNEVAVYKCKSACTTKKCKCFKMAPGVQHAVTVAWAVATEVLTK